MLTVKMIMMIVKKKINYENVSPSLILIISLFFYVILIVLLTFLLKCKVLLYFFLYDRSVRI